MAVTRQTASTVVMVAQIAAAAGLCGVAGTTLLRAPEPRTQAKPLIPDDGNTEGATEPVSQQPDFTFDPDLVADLLQTIAPRPPEAKKRDVREDDDDPKTQGGTGGGEERGPVTNADPPLGWRYIGRIQFGSISIGLIRPGDGLAQRSVRVGDRVPHPDLGDIEVVRIDGDEIVVRHSGAEETVELAQATDTLAVSTASMSGPAGTPGQAAGNNARSFGGSREPRREVDTTINADDPLEVRRQRLAELREQRRLQREQAQRGEVDRN